MKNIVKACAILAALASLAACNKYADYTTAPFVSLDTRSATIAESDPATTWTLPVHVYNVSGSTTVSYTVEPITAKEGVDYTVSDASGVLTFPEGTDTQNITFSISGQPGVYTGSVRFRVVLNSATNDVQLGASKVCTVTISDKDLLVDWKYLEGEWTAQDYDGEDKDGGTYKIKITKVDDTNLTIYNLWGGETTLKATVTFGEGATSATLSIPHNQVVYDATADGYGELLLLGQNDAGNWAYVPVKASISSDGFIIGPWNMLITAGDYEGYLWTGSLRTELTK